MSADRLYAQKGHLEDEINKLEITLRQKCDQLSFTSRSDIHHDLDTVRRMKEILIGLRKEHQLLMTRIDAALDTVSRTCNEATGHARMTSTQILNQPQSFAHQFGSAPPLQPQPTDSMFRHPNQLSIASTMELDSLVKRVQIAVGEDVPRTPDRKVKRKSLPDSPVEPLESFHCGEMSVASKQYLQKYGLLNGGNSPLRRHSPTYRGMSYEPSSSLKEPERSYSSILYNYHNQNNYNYQKRERREAERDENILDMENLRRLPKLT